jgi:hypothetical protein
MTNDNSQSLSEDLRYKRSHHAVASTLDNSVCLFNLQTCDYLSLNETGSAIWECIQEPLTLEAITHHLMAVYEVNANECRSELEIWLQSAVRLGVVDVVS